LIAFSESTDGDLFFEQINLNVIREAWLQKENSIKGVLERKDSQDT
jgi:hypothetical protein